MVKLYADLIEKGLRTIDQVPAAWRTAVQAEVERRQAAANA